MINKQSNALSFIKKALKGISSVNFVGLYPNFHKVTHDNMPAILIKDGDEEKDTDFDRNGLYEYNYLVELHLYQLNDKLQFDCLTVQAAVCDAIVDDPTLGGAAVCTDILSVQKGEYSNAASNTSPYICDEDNMRIITLQIKLSTQR